MKADASYSTTTETDPRLATAAGYIPTLDGWRAIAVLGVIVYHGVSPRAIGYGLAEEGYRGVNIFFGISGFLICSKLLQDEVRKGTINLSGFYVRRFFRIIPPALVYLAAIGLLGMVGLLMQLPRTEWLSCVFFFRNYVAPRQVTYTEYTGHFWSLSVEEHFYFMLPGTLYLMGIPRTRILIPIMAVAVAGWRFFDSRYDLFSRLWPLTYSPQRTDRSVDGLLWGAALALLLTHKPLREWVGLNLTMFAWTGLLAIYVLLAAAGPPLTLMFEAMLIPLLIYGTALHPASLVGKFLENSVIRWIGRISYSLYLWQQMFFIARYHSPAMLQTFPLNALGLLACACASYYLIERPMIAMGHRLSRSPALTPPAEAAARDRR